MSRLKTDVRAKLAHIVLGDGEWHNEKEHRIAREAFIAALDEAAEKAVVLPNGERAVPLRVLLELIEAAKP